LTISTSCIIHAYLQTIYPNFKRGVVGFDRMVVGFATTYAISAYYHKRCEF